MTILIVLLTKVMIIQISGEIPQVSVAQCFDFLVLNDMLDHSLIWYPIGKGASVSHLALVCSVSYLLKAVHN
jgi:hypothetical protein